MSTFFNNNGPIFSTAFIGNFENQNNPSEQLSETHNIPVLPVFGNMAMPDLPQPIKLTGKMALDVAEKSYQEDCFIVIASVLGDKDKPVKLKDFFEIGVIAKVAKIIKLPDSSQIAFISAFQRALITHISKTKPIIEADVELISEPSGFYGKTDEEIEIMLENLVNNHKQILNFFPEEAKESLNVSLKDPEPLIVRKLYNLGNTVPFLPEEKYEILKSNSIYDLIETLLKNIDKVLQRLTIQASIHMRTHENISSQQKEIFLKQQIKTIQEELGDFAGDNDKEELNKKASEKIWSRKAREHFDKELKKLDRYPMQSPEYSIQLSYLETLLDLPWDKYSNENFTLSKIEKILDRDHYGLEKVKQRILEYMAVIKLRNDLKSPIICLYGPPGVGKTSLGKSIAEAMGRQYARVSLGGIHDEAEIRGHRRTYIGAMPGRIISSLSKVGEGNPVFVLDEIDKIRKDYKGDPSAALLEVLDPEQNSSFHDNYIDTDYDLSKILFIATANDLSDIDKPLLDRMEVIEISGYTPEEKIEIAKRHLINKCLENNGLNKGDVKLDKNVLLYIITHYTHESGVRQLEKSISEIMRKVAYLKASGKSLPKTINIDKVKEYLGLEKVDPEGYTDNKYAGVVTGLAWTQAGGDILFIETSLSKGKGDKLTLTGNLGDVMKESATIAFEYVKAHAEEIGIDPKLFSEYNVHIHVPQGAVPKDGPSAGITLITSIVSAFTGKKVKERLAMTGEVTLRGKVLPVGGIKEKILAAKRAGIREIILSENNRKNISEIDPSYLSNLEFHFVEKVDDILPIALLNEKAEYHY